MNNIVAFPVGALDSKSKERLTKAGIIWIECDGPGPGCGHGSDYGSGYGFG